MIDPSLELFKVKSKKKTDTQNPSTPSKQTTNMSMPPPPSPTSALIQSSPSTNSLLFSPSPSKKLPRDDHTRVTVVTRDRECVVLNITEDMCIMSHIIPAALLRVCHPLLYVLTRIERFCPCRFIRLLI